MDDERLFLTKRREQGNEKRGKRGGGQRESAARRETDLSWSGHCAV